jgi:hypothetical protein
MGLILSVSSADSFYIAYAALMKLKDLIKRDF